MPHAFTCHAEQTGASDDSGPKPKKMQRAKTWSHEVENVFRLQEAGFCKFRSENPLCSRRNLQKPL